jgi:hypothetical protein
LTTDHVGLLGVKGGKVVKIATRDGVAVTRRVPDPDRFCPNTLPTAEAEYVAATHAAKECIWLQRLIKTLFDPFPAPTTLF